MLHRRRLNGLQYVLLGVLFGSSFYLWTRRASIHNQLEQTVITFETSTASKRIVEEEEEIPPIVDPLSVNACSEATEAAGIEPFPKFQFDPEEKKDLNRTLNWLDLWNNDTNCLKYDVQLLRPGSQPKPGALVSFPGSGNSWLRMLVMGITGIFTSSVYDGEDSLFVPKCIFDTIFPIVLRVIQSFISFYVANDSITYALPIDCGCTLLQKTHDFSLDASLYYLPEANRTHTLEQFNKKGILIIRNPFKAIPSYRNFGYTGMMGAAPKSAFEGKGIIIFRFVFFSS